MDRSAITEWMVGGGLASRTDIVIGDSSMLRARAVHGEGARWADQPPAGTSTSTSTGAGADASIGTGPCMGTGTVHCMSAFDTLA